MYNKSHTYTFTNEHIKRMHICVDKNYVQTNNILCKNVCICEYNEGYSF